MKPELLVFMCMMQTAHSAAQSLDRLTIEYLTCATIPVRCTRSPTLATIVIDARHAAPVTYTP
jgi:hypothetical protein